MSNISLNTVMVFVACVCSIFIDILFINAKHIRKCWIHVMDDHCKYSNQIYFQRSVCYSNDFPSFQER